MIDRTTVDCWLGAYIEAWKSYDRAAIAELFSEDVEYRYHPYDEPIRGRDAVVRAWLGEEDNPDVSERDKPGTYDASYRAVAVDGDVAVAVGESTYTDPVTAFDNCFVMRFDDEGRCREFTEWFIERPGQPD